MASKDDRILPTGNCWCGCGTDVGIGSFFAPGQDKVAEAALLAARYENSDARLIRHHGFGPDNSVRQAALDSGRWEAWPVGGCDYLGTPSSIRNHRRRLEH